MAACPNCAGTGTLTCGTCLECTGSGRVSAEAATMLRRANVARDTSRKQRRGGTRGRAVPARWRPICGRPDCEGRQSKCRHCKAAYMRDWRPAHSELPAEERRRLNCRAYTNCYQRRGVWPAGPCVSCGATQKVENHHPDYSRPDVYQRLCRTCHRRLHRNGETHGQGQADRR